jgi:PAS domain S-box-containing protein
MKNRMAAQPAADRPAAPATAAPVSGFEPQRQIVALLSADGIILEANRTLLAALGFAAAEVIGRPFVEVGWPEAEGRRLQADIAEAASGTPVRREIALSGPAGELWLDFSLQPVRDPGSGAVSLLIAEGCDNTLRRSLATRLAQTQKMQALGELASGIAHDFNNILQTIAGAAELIALRTGEDRILRLTRMILGATARGTSVTERLLAFSHRREPRMEALVVAELLEGVREVLVHSIGPAIKVIADVPAGLPPVMADRGQLETGLVNLAANSRDAMPHGGSLTLAAAHVADGGGLAGLAGGEYVRIDVADTGGGMDAATLACAAEPFYTTKPPGQGTGLGLPMVKEFAEQSGGAMTIASTPGAGTTVSLWLRAAATAAQAASGEAGGAAAAGARVLLVDDDDAVRETMGAQLQDLGFVVLTAADGVAALALIEGGEAVDVLVCDLSMPHLSGVETIRQARALAPDLPCLLLTGYVGERAALSAEGAFSVVRKPITGDALAECIASRLRQGNAAG